MSHFWIHRMSQFTWVSKALGRSTFSYGLFFISVWLFGSKTDFAIAQEKPVAEQVKNDPVLAMWRYHGDVQGCYSCHYGLTVRFDSSFSRQTEMGYWMVNDKHAIARRRVEPLKINELATFEAEEKRLKDRGSPGFDENNWSEWLSLSNSLSRSICMNMGYDVDTAAGYAKFKENCLTCHGGYSGEKDDKSFARDEPKAISRVYRVRIVIKRARRSNGSALTRCPTALRGALVYLLKRPLQGCVTL